jgi:hypothetical protein
MQAWQIIVASAVAASIAVAVLFLPGAVQSPSSVASLIQTYWLEATIVWLGTYGVAALVFSTVTSARELEGGASDAVGQDWPRRYLRRLGVTQYFSAVLILLALALLPVAAMTQPYFSLPAAIGSSLALIACGVAILVGVLGWLTAAIAAAFHTPAVVTDPPASLDTRLLREIIDLLRARPIEPGLAVTELTEELRQRDRSTVEAIKELAGAINRVRNGISEIQHGLQHRGPEQAGQSGSAAPADAADIASELRAATAALTEAVTKLDDIAAGLTVLSLSPVGLSPPARGNLPPASRSQLSTELQELLRDMASSPAPHGEGSR